VSKWTSLVAVESIEDSMLTFDENGVSRELIEGLFEDFVDALANGFCFDFDDGVVVFLFSKSNGGIDCGFHFLTV
jgi:hypothetical protein